MHSKVQSVLDTSHVRYSRPCSLSYFFFPPQLLKIRSKWPNFSFCLESNSNYFLGFLHFQECCACYMKVGKHCSLVDRLLACGLDTLKTVNVRKQLYLFCHLKGKLIILILFVKVFEFTLGSPDERYHPYRCSILRETDFCPSRGQCHII